MMLTFKIVNIFILFSLFAVVTAANNCSLPCSECSSIGAVCCEGHCVVQSAVGESCSSCPGYFSFQFRSYLSGAVPALLVSMVLASILSLVVLAPLPMTALLAKSALLN